MRRSFLESKVLGQLAERDGLTGLFNRRHFQGVMHVDERYAVEWAAIPHFFYDFYVYQYSTGIVAAHALAEALLTGDTKARERYGTFLRSGGSDHPLELLRKAGVDLESAAPYDAAMQGIVRRIDALDALIG